MALLAAFNAYGYDFENGNVYYDILSVEDHTCEVVSFGLEYANSYSGEVVIPNIVSHQNVEYTVVRVDDFAFSQCGSLKSVTLPNSVCEIGKYAFFDSKSLEKIDFGEGVSNIDEYAFYGCSSLSVICLPQKVRKIPYFAFGYCKNLTGITLPKDIEKIEDNAFTLVNLSEVNSMNVNVPKCKGAAVFDSNVYLNAELYVPQEALSAYQEADVWKNFLSISGKQFGGAELIYNDLTVAVNGLDLIVNAQEGVAVNVYNVAGQCIYSGANHQVQLPACGVYIVNVGGKVSKILVK